MAAGTAAQFGGMGGGMGGMGRLIGRSILCGPGALTREILEGGLPFFWADESAEPSGPIWADVQTTDLREIKEADHDRAWTSGTYWLNSLCVLRAEHPLDPAPWRTRFSVLAASNVGNIHYRPPTQQDFPRIGRMGMGGMGRGGQDWPASRTVQLPQEYWAKTASAFEARPGQVNEWTIPLPDELIEAVRKELKLSK
jgi:hypothetical protein